MTRTRNARIAGLSYLAYIAVGIGHQVVINPAIRAEGTAAQLARIAEHATLVRVSILLTLIECIAALVLAVALYGITRDEDHELAMLAMVCRVAEGIINSMAIPNDLGLLWLVKAGRESGALDPTTTNVLGAFLLRPGGPLGAIFFAVGSTIFCYLLLRGRMVPASLAHLGIFSSALLVVGLPLQLAGFFTGPLTGYQWLPATVFAIVFPLWLLIKGVDAPAARFQPS